MEEVYRVRVDVEA